MKSFGLSISGLLLTFGIFGATLRLESYYGRKIEAAEARQISVTGVPLTLGQWQGEDVSALTERESKILKLDNYIRRTYRNPEGDEVFVYIGFWKKQSGEHQAAKHSPLMCLPANGWNVSKPSDIMLSPTPEHQNVRMRRLLAQLGKSRPPELFYYWFFSGNETYTDESEALLKLVKQSLIDQRSDGGIIEISTSTLDPKKQIASDKRADEVLQQFIVEFYPVLEKIVRD
jgi:EpsI family protein